MSPFELVQEMAVAGEPKYWRLMVACALLNRTHGRQVRPMYGELMNIAPTPGTMLNALRSGEVDRLLKPLGFINRRRGLLGEMAKDVLDGKPFESCKGVGDYCRASAAIFIDGRIDVVTEDPWLNKYLAWRRDAINRGEGSCEEATDTSKTSTTETASSRADSTV